MIESSRRFSVLLSVATFAALVAAPAVGQTIFNDFPEGSTSSYLELYSDFVTPAPAAQFTSDSLGYAVITCVDGLVLAPPFNNCGSNYEGFATYDFNTGASNMVGVAVLPQNQDFVHQAAVWVPAEQGGAGIVLLSDLSVPYLQTNAAQYNFTGLGTQIYQHGSYAFDIAGDSSVIVGMADGYTRTIRVEVDAAPQSALPPSNQPAPSTLPLNHWYLPIYWSATGTSRWGEGTVLSMLTSGSATAYTVPYPRPIGGALAVSQNGQYIVGWNGNLASNGAARFVQAVLWDGVADTPQSLGWLGSPPPASGINAGRNPYSVANDVNDLRQVVGWSGNLNFIPFRDVILYDYSASGSNPSASWQPKPFVWTQQIEEFDDNPTNYTGMRPLSMMSAFDGTSATPTDNEWTYGEARAISNNGNVAVGWVVRNDTESYDPARAAAWLNTPASEEQGGYPDWFTSTLVLLPTPTPTINPCGEVCGVAPDAMANAVDANGKLVVGKVFFSQVPNPPNPPNSQAAFWLLGYDLQDGMLVPNSLEVSGGLIEEALAEAGVPIVSTDENELTLTEATAVQVVLDGEGNPQEVYVTGVGQGSFGSWIASIIGTPGLTTPQSAIQSLAVAEQGARDAAEGLGFVAENQRCVRPEGTSAEEEPWCFFVVGKGMLYVDTGANGIQIGKNVGLAYFFDDDTQIGGSFGLDWLSGQVQGGSTYQALLGSVGVYAAHEPEEGIRAVGSAVYGRILKATFNRVYVNGTGTATSTGTTSGQGFGLYGELGYGFALDEKTRVVPYISASYNRSDLAGWTDTGGPFNATIAPISNSSVALSAGVKSEHDVSEDLMIYAILEATAIRHQGSGVNATIAAAPFAIGAPNTWNGMVSATAGVKKEFDAHTNGYGQVTLSTNFGGYFGAAIQAGFNRTF